MQKQFKGIQSTAIHSALNDNNQDAHLNPIYATSTFTYDTTQQGMDRFSGTDKSKIYSRWANPTCLAVEQTIEALESFGIKKDDGTPLQLKGLLHSSGQAAMTTLFLSNLKSGDAVISHYSLYGGTYEILHKILADAGIEIFIVDFNHFELVKETILMQKNIKLMHIETPANPTNQCVDIETLTFIAKENNLLVSVDNTFATPYLQQPFKFGVDYVIHSTTKFLNGHGTAIGGILLGKNIELMQTKVWKWFALLGGNSNPFDAFLLLNGIKTLALRMDKHCENAQLLANYLQNHPKVEVVNYAGLNTHRDFVIAKKQMKMAAPVFSFSLRGGLEEGIKFQDKLKMCKRAVSLGTVDTLISHPASTTHYSVPKEERLKFGITDGLIRISVGIEHIEDIIDDIDQALN